jgi:predicted RNase H-like nuclease (RuvC/YqgF family)
MKTLYLALLIVAVGVITYLLLSRKPNQYIIGPSQTELDSIRAKHAQDRKSLTSRLDSLQRSHKHDSTLRVQENKQSRRTIKKLKDRADSLLAQLNDSTPCCTASDVKSRVIAIKDTVIEKLESRIVNDSLFTVNLQANFEQRLKASQDEQQILRDELKLKDAEMLADKQDIKRRKKAGWIKNGVILGLLVLLTQTVD